jgi:hypothetical protein
MPYDSPELDADIIRAAYAEKVKEAFKLFAENIAVGQAEKSCRERFQRSLELLRKARDMAVQSSSGGGPVEPTAAEDGLGSNAAAEPLSAEDQAMIDHVLSGTTGTHAPPPPASSYRR